MHTLTEFRKTALEHGMPQDAIDYWVSLARPYLSLDGDGNGPVMGYFGGRPALPASVPWPAGHAHLASVDLAAIPGNATDLDLPADGTLVFFAVPGKTSTVGRVVHVPADAAVAEAEPPDGVTVYARFPLHGVLNVSLPENAADSPRYAGAEPRDDRALFERISDDLDGLSAVLRLGGFGTWNGTETGVPTGAGEVLLAEFCLDPSEVGADFETEYATVFYVIGRDDLGARDFAAARMATDFDKSTMLDDFREAARRKGMPDDAIDYWVSLARPCIAVDTEGIGPVVGHFGGYPSLPASVAWPVHHAHLATIDLAAIGKYTTELDLPTAGTLVFFAVPEIGSDEGRVVYVPAGEECTEAEPPDDQTSVYDRAALHATPDWSLPDYAGANPRYLADGARDDEDLFAEISWDLPSYGLLVLGGFGRSNTGGLGVPVDDFETHLLLAEFFLHRGDVGDDFGTDYTTVFYMCSREDLAARRFEAVEMVSDFLG
ncbi:hypothetical protein ACSNOB_10820 [Micromonospora sp. URMC 106]|uniref:hypothetical protein n=1 Tax=Micromonospora sp. URMC 106 TaxID=3423408 RepID=UPI003F19DCE7